MAWHAATQSSIAQPERYSKMMAFSTLARLFTQYTLVTSACRATAFVCRCGSLIQKPVMVQRTSVGSPLDHYLLRQKTLLSGTGSEVSNRSLRQDLQAELDAKGLGLCHGILHASGVRRISDLSALTSAQMKVMGVDTFDRHELLRVIEDLSLMDDGRGRRRSARSLPPEEISTSIDGAFAKERFEDIQPSSGDESSTQAVSAEHHIFKGKLFSVEQCNQINRMAEYHAYSCVGSIGTGWTNELYTLTDQHMQCRDVPNLISATNHTFSQFKNSLYSLFPGRIRANSIAFESTGEPHLVKYQGKAKGTVMHTDNPKDVSITLNVMLSAKNDFTGGGTFIEVLNTTIHLEQGEVLIHLGDLQHAGEDITGGVRRLLVGFCVCEWQ